MSYENIFTPALVSQLVGQGATVRSGSDSYPYTIYDSSESGKTIYLKQDKFERIDSNGFSEIQEYKYSANPDGELVKATLRKDGRYKTTKDNQLVTVGVRRRYFDFSF